MERRLTTILAADLAGYSRLMSADEEGVIARLRAARAELIDPAIAEGSGRIVKTMGDGLLAEFSSPVAAVRAALAVQDGMRAREATEPEERRLRFRVGINLGDVVIDGEDVLGDAVNVAARLESLAPVGGLCIGRAVFEQARGRVSAEMTPLGPQAVKNLPEPVEVWRVEVAGAEAPKAAPLRAERPSGVAVLPFENLSSDPEQEFLADGIVEDVITELSRFRSLFVIARNSTFAYKGETTDVRRIARELGVRYVVEGSVRRSGDRIRLTAQLIDAETGAHVWADRWDRVVDDLFALQDDLTSAIVSAVEPELGAHERKLARARPSDSLTAWELYQRAVSEQVKFTGESFAEADALLERAVAIDPNFALAHAMRARVAWADLATNRAKDPAETIRQGIGSARRALEIDDRQELAHASLGVLLTISGRARDAAASVEVALALNPRNAVCHYAATVVSTWSAQPDGELIERAGREALRLSPRDPLRFMFHYQIGSGIWLRNGCRTTDEVLEAFDLACGQPNAEWFVFFFAAYYNVEAGREDVARELLFRARERMPALSLAFVGKAWGWMPSWAKLRERMGPDLERLVELGLPKE